MNQFELAELLFAHPDINLMLVGGGVRDVLLNQEIKDLDFVIHDYEDLNLQFKIICDFITQSLNNQYILKVQDRLCDFLTFKISVLDLNNIFQYELDFVFSRKEKYDGIASIPAISPGTLNDDLNRRDFSVNAIASKSLACKALDLFDCHSGVQDLDQKKIRILHDKSFRDDPIRMIRGIRFCRRFDFRFEEKTEKLFLQAIKERYLNYLTPGRRYAEVLKVLNESNGVEILIDLCKLNLLGDFMVLEDFHSERLLASFDQYRYKIITAYDFFSLIVALEKDHEVYLKKFSMGRILKTKILEKADDFRNC